VTGTLYLGCAMVDHTTRSLASEMAMLVTDGRVGWLGLAEEAPAPGPGVEVVDAGGTTAVAGLVDAHSHLALPGGSHWIDRAGDPTDRLLAVAEDNARLLRQAGVRWARDVGAPVRDGRALSLTVRERWRGRAGYPYIRAAGCWVARTGSLPSGLPVEVEDGDGLLATTLGQLDAGADLVKLYMDGPEKRSKRTARCRWTAAGGPTAASSVTRAPPSRSGPSWTSWADVTAGACPAGSAHAELPGTG
jgi:hypothetical protein